MKQAMSYEGRTGIMLERASTFLLEYYDVTTKVIIKATTIITHRKGRYTVKLSSNFGITHSPANRRLDRLLMMPVLPTLIDITKKKFRRELITTHNIINQPLVIGAALVIK